MFNCLVICHGQGKVIEYSDIELEHYFRFQIVCSTICVKYWLVNAFILNNNTSIVYISNLLQTCYIVLVNILVLVIIQSPFYLNVNTNHTTNYTPSNIEVRTLRHPSGCRRADTVDYKIYKLELCYNILPVILEWEKEKTLSQHEYSITMLPRLITISQWT